MTKQCSPLVWHKADGLFCDFFASASCWGEANEYRINAIVVVAATTAQDGEVIEVTGITRHTLGYKTVYSPQHGANTELGVFDDLDAAKRACSQHYAGGPRWWWR